MECDVKYSFIHAKETDRLVLLCSLVKLWCFSMPVSYLYKVYNMCKSYSSEIKAMKNKTC